MLAFVTVQLLAFAFAFSVDLPGAYALFAVASTGTVAYYRDGGPFGVAAATFGSVLLVVVALPLLMLVARQDPGTVVEKAMDPAVHRSLYLSVYAPLLAALLSVALGVPLALLLARGFPGQTLVESLVDLPLVVPHSVAGLAVLFAYGNQGAFDWLELSIPGAFTLLGVPVDVPLFDGFHYDFSVLGTTTGMVLAMTFVSAPFAVNAAREGFEAVDARVQRAARTLGANRWETFRRVTAPLSVRGVLTGGVLAWARSVSEFGAVAIVAYNVDVVYPPLFGEMSDTQHAPVFIYREFITGGLGESGAVATLLLGLSIAIFLVIRSLAYDDGGWP